jgi:hypothetical protein
MYTTNAIDMATPYVSARAATTAPITPHGKRVGDGVAEFDGIANVRRRHFDFSSAGCGRGTIPCTENECRLLLSSCRDRIIFVSLQDSIVCDKTLEVSTDA